MRGCLPRHPLHTQAQRPAHPPAPARLVSSVQNHSKRQPCLCWYIGTHISQPNHCPRAQASGHSGHALVLERPILIPGPHKPSALPFPTTPTAQWRQVSLVAVPGLDDLYKGSHLGLGDQLPAGQHAPCVCPPAGVRTRLQSGRSPLEGVQAWLQPSPSSQTGPCWPCGRQIRPCHFPVFS